jgi:glycosyltransferase involved in cell wall biosynthesis
VSPAYSVVIPTVGRESLARTLAPVLHEAPAAPAEVIVVDDRRDDDTRALQLPAGPVPVQVLRTGGRGPAVARNAGWRRATTEWVAFLDDDVVPDDEWCVRLRADLQACSAEIAASQGRVHVPLPSTRAPNDWERNVAGLTSAPWITADMAVRRSVLAETGGFDERFRLAYREDVDLALRVVEAGYGIVRGERRVTHPVRPAPWHVSLRAQRGNAWDPLMDALHGRGWRDRCGASRGARRQHVVVTCAAAAAVLAAVAGRRRWATVPAALWAAGTAAFAWRRIAPGPRDAGEVAAMVATSAALPPLAVGWWLAGRVRAARARPWPLV